MSLKRIVCYCRVSTERQETSNQVLQLKEFIARRPDWKLTEIYEEQASGTDDSRPVLARLVQDGLANKYDVLLVWRLDRLGRSILKILNVLSELASTGISFASATEGLDTTTPHGRLVLQFLAVISSYEVEIIRQRVSAGLARAVASGIKLGRPRVGFDIAQAIQLHNEGQGYRRIAKRLGVSHATVYRTLLSVSKTPAVKTA